jgi:hypothetical protein
MANATYAHRTFRIPIFESRTVKIAAPRHEERPLTGVDVAKVGDVAFSDLTTHTAVRHVCVTLSMLDRSCRWHLT